MSDPEASRATARLLVEGLEADERRALACLVNGCSLIGIAAELGMSLEQAAGLKAALVRKLGVTKTADLVRVGIYAGVGLTP